MKKKVFLYVHSHWDREWYREFEEFRLRLIEVVDDIINKLESNELPSFYFDGQTAALEDYLAIYPEREAKIKKFIKEKRLFIGPFYCSADSFLVSSEFMIRNLCIGIEQSNNFGCNEFIGYLSDTFGHSEAMSEILKSSGIETAMMWRGLGNLPSELLWKDLKVTYLIQGYFQDFLSMKADYDKKAELLEKYIDKIAERSSNNILLPCGADHLKVADNIPKQIEELNKRLKNYKIIISNPFEYLNTVKNNYKTSFNKEFIDSSKNFLLKGVYSSRIYQKRKNALCQWNLSRLSEPMATISHTLGFSKNFQNELDYAYKTLIKNHAHDSIYGCSIDPVHKDVERRFDNTLQICHGIKKRVVRDLSENSDELSFFNLSNFPYRGTVEIETEKRLDKKYCAQPVSYKKAFPDKKLFDAAQIPVTEDITKIYKYLVEVENLKPFSISQGKILKNRTNKITNTSIENDYLALEIKNGKLTLEDKKQNKIYKNFIEIIDRADVGDSYNFGPLKNDKPLKAKIISSKILVDGHIKSTLRVVFELKIPKTSDIKTLSRSKTTLKHKLYMDISLSNSEDYMSVNLNWENRSKQHLLQVRFNLPEPVSRTVSEDSLGLVEREFDPNYDISKLVPAPRGIELKTNTAPMQRFVWAQDFGLITKGLNEYEISQNTLNLTILRATELISEPHNTSRGTPAGPPLHCPDLQCCGENKAEFCLRFTPEAETLYQTAEAFYGCVVPLFTTKEIKGFFKINNKNILAQAIKLNKQNEIIIRLTNISNKAESFSIEPPEGYSKVLVSDSQENTLKSAPKKIKISPKGLITIKCTK